jgi:hypothetical protein
LLLKYKKNDDAYCLVKFGFLHSCSSGSFPQNPQGSLDLFRNGLWLAQVPANFPFFFTNILIAIPAKAKAINTKVKRNNLNI